MDLTAKIEAAEVAIWKVFEAGHKVVCAVSGGKDSGVTLSLALNAAIRHKQAGGEPSMTILHAETGIDNPEVSVLAHQEIAKAQSYAESHGIVLQVMTARPTLNDLWAVRIIGGRALPTFANSATRDCTISLKIQPMTRAKKALVAKLTEDDVPPVTLIGTRFDESSGRAARMSERGETEDRPWQGDDGLYMSPIARFTLDDIIEYVGLANAGAIRCYSDFAELMRIYNASEGATCFVVSVMKEAGAKQGKACGARTGCSLCCAVGVDKSLVNMIESDERYGYMRELNRLQRFLVNTQYDLSRRQWVGRTINEAGYIAVRPDAYHPNMLEALLRYALTIDVREQEAAMRLGIAPRFQLVTLEALIAIDALWSMQGFSDRPFHALSIYREVYLDGRRYDVPDVPMAPKADIQAVRWLHVGNDWDEGRLRLFTGLRDPILDGFAFPCMGSLKPLKDGKLVLDVRTEDFFTVDTEGAALLLDFELDRLLEIHDDPKRGLITKGFMTYVEFGTLAFAKNQVGTVDRILRRTAWKERHGLTGPGYDLDTLMERTISDKEMRRLLDGKPELLEQDPVAAVTLTR